MENNTSVHLKFWEQIMQQASSAAPATTNTEDEFQFSMRQVGLADEFEAIPHFHGSNPANAPVPTFSNVLHYLLFLQIVLTFYV